MVVKKLLRSQCLIAAVANFLETDTINPEEIEETMLSLTNMSDIDLMDTLIQSHILREEIYACKYFRQVN